MDIAIGQLQMFYKIKISFFNYLESYILKI